MVVEGAQAVIGLYELGQQMSAEMPITSAVHAVFTKVLARRNYFSSYKPLPNEEFYGND